MPRRRKPGYAAIAILKALKSGSRYGLDLMFATDLPSGTVYPQLGRLEARGLVRAEWESEDVARREARPKRRYYQITQSGDDLLSAEQTAEMLGKAPSTVRTLMQTGEIPADKIGLPG